MSNREFYTGKPVGETIFREASLRAALLVRGFSPSEILDTPKERQKQVDERRKAIKNWNSDDEREWLDNS